MKRILALLFALLLLLPSLTLGDVIVEPENGFYRNHQSECKRIAGRTYLANGPEGTLDLYTAPNGTVSTTLKNGAAFYCQWVYTDKQGAVWGFSERHEAWAPLGYAQVQYDHIAFEQEHRDQIVPGTDQTGIKYDSVYLYDYPGATYPILLDEVELYAEQTYTDPQGRRWGFVSYIYGIRDKWFCLDDPGNGELAAETRSAAPSGYDPPASLPTGSQTGVVIGVVAGVVAGTLVAVLVLFRRKKRA